MPPETELAAFDTREAKVVLHPTAVVFSIQALGANATGVQLLDYSSARR